MPEPRFCHAAVAIGYSIIVAGGISSFTVDMRMKNNPPSAKAVYQLDLVQETFGDTYKMESRWKYLNSMGN